MATKTASAVSVREFTIRGVIVGALITLVFTAANVYLGLKVGLTFASSIPAAVISMAVLRALRNGSIQENNIVQTIASAAGTLSSIIFVLPGLVMVGWWTGFPFWETFGVCAIGGVLGVMYSVPLRRAMVTTSDLPYPEGVAAAEVLHVGAGARALDPEQARESKIGLLSVVLGTGVSALFAALVGTRISIDEIDQFFRIGNASTGIGFSLSLALVGVGHLVGLTVGIAMFGGVFLAWGILTPLLSALHPAPGDVATVANGVWRHQVRFIGAGTIGAASIWSLGRLAMPVVRGVASSLAASRKLAEGHMDIPRIEQDLSIRTIAIVSIASLVPLAALFAAFLNGGPLAGNALLLIGGALVYVVIAGFFVAAACGYMAGLIGSSNSPVSGLAILSVLGASLLLVILAHGAAPSVAPALVAYALFVTAVVLCVATISNDNLQDLKTGQLVDATPWKQQVALIIGVGFGAAVIPPILDLLNHAYGFAGAPAANVGATLSHPLPAPQATLISALAKGVIGGDVPWNLIGIGALLGLVIIAIDEALRKTGRAFPPLAVGLGIYLPAGTILATVAGSIIGHAYNRWCARTKNVEASKRMGVLLSSGFIVGESLFGVLLAGIIVASGNGTPLAIVGDAFAVPSNVIGGLVFAVCVAASYRWTMRRARTLGMHS
jgi:putative OPT family oligopeptide transporter